MGRAERARPGRPAHYAGLMRRQNPADAGVPPRLQAQLAVLRCCQGRDGGGAGTNPCPHYPKCTGDSRKKVLDASRTPGPFYTRKHLHSRSSPWVSGRDYKAHHVWRKPKFRDKKSFFEIPQTNNHSDARFNYCDIARRSRPRARHEGTLCNIKRLHGRCNERRCDEIGPGRRPSLRPRRATKKNPARGRGVIRSRSRRQASLPHDILISTRRRPPSRRILPGRRRRLWRTSRGLS
ncbi:MAG: hypothetical protein JWN24_4121 [Phycisphaerales bacterium]|nr:hypothetical protein [Phycisphaerales bacterium]